MSRALLVALVLVVGLMYSMTGHVSAQIERDPPDLFCWGDNVHWTECGSACAPTCRNPNPEMCHQACVRGCQCDRGYYMRDDGACVRFEDC